ncbi:UPF0187-domain-containing protein [Agrocybe pediades]|nr:UPF0187-domain-containing protein [Agrocybe pediades]
MVASNPLFRRWTTKKFAATVMDDIWPEVIFFTLIAVMVVLVSEKTSAHLGVSNQLLTVLGLVLGLVISFRTSSAYERYQDGRKLWTEIIVASRNLAQMIWIHVPDNREAREGAASVTSLDSIIEKKTMISLIQAYAVSVKHLLRGEQGVYYKDLYPLIAFLPRYANGIEAEDEKLPLWQLPEDDAVYTTISPLAPLMALIHHPEVEPKILAHHDRDRTVVNEEIIASENESSCYPFGQSRREEHEPFQPEVVLPDVPSERPLRPARNPPEVTMYDYVPLLRLFRWIFRVVTGRDTDPAQEKKGKKKQDEQVVESHIPLEILLVLSDYSAYLMRNKLVEPSIAAGITSNLTSLQDTVSHLERICNTPLPFAYQAHLRMSLWIYLALLPFQIYTSYGVITIPATTFSSFLLLGFLEIGQEIENPFNYDLNDIDLDYFCLSLHRQLHEICAHVNSDPHSYVYAESNQPFAPSNRISAPALRQDRDLAQDTEHGIQRVRSALVRGWKEVDTKTRRNTPATKFRG